MLILKALYRAARRWIRDTKIGQLYIQEKRELDDQVAYTNTKKREEDQWL